MKSCGRMSRPAEDGNERPCPITRSEDSSRSSVAKDMEWC